MKTLRTVILCLYYGSGPIMLVGGMIMMFCGFKFEGYFTATLGISMISIVAFNFIMGTSTSMWGSVRHTGHIHHIHEHNHNVSQSLFGSFQAPAYEEVQQITKQDQFGGYQQLSQTKRYF